MQFDLADGQVIDWQGCKFTALATPGHSRDHLAFEVGGWVFAGDAITGTGHLWSPYTTDWDHWTDAGLAPAAASLKKLASRKPSQLLPARGPVVATEIEEFLGAAARRIEEAGFLKSFERYTNREGNPPQYDYLVPAEQIGSGGDKPWSRVSPHLWITGNTYVLASREGPCLVVDPWGERSVKQIAALRAAEKLGPIERVVFTHAHYDHFDGVYTLPGREGFQIWCLEDVAEPLRDPFKLRAPFLDARPITFDKTFAPGAVATWHEYTFRFSHLPGQSWYTCGIETTIDGKRCYFTADNFFHQKQYSGSGGWMGLNRSSPLMYAESAEKVLAAKPEWILAEHGGPYVFHPEDYARRVRWGQAAGRAMDALSPTGTHRNDWNPHRIAVEPVRVTARAGDLATFTIRASNRSPRPEQYTVRIRATGLAERTIPIDSPAGEDRLQQVTFPIPANWQPGRHIVDILPTRQGQEAADPFFAVDVVK